jgi:chorismate--pyruvate lyase
VGGAGGESRESRLSLAAPGVPCAHKMEASQPTSVLNLHEAARHETFSARDAGATTLSPAWKMLLFGDGSPTRLLTLLAGAPLVVSVLGMEALEGGNCSGSIGVAGPSPASAGSSSALPPPPPPPLPPQQQQLAALWAPLALAPETIAPPRVLRRVWLEAPAGQRVGYACSWWGAADVAAFLPDQRAPIGGALVAQRHEIHRELLCVVHAVGHAALEGGLGLAPGGGSAGAARALLQPGADWGAQELWGRWYVMRQGGAPLCVIYEVFSPLLEQYLGQRHLGTPAGAAAGCSPAAPPH